MSTSFISSHTWSVFHAGLAFYLALTGIVSAASTSNMRWRVDDSVVTDGRIFLPPGPGGCRFNKPANTLWKGQLKRGNTIIVDRETGNGFSTPDMFFGDLTEGSYTFYLRLVGVNDSKRTFNFSVRRSVPPTITPPTIIRDPDSARVCLGMPVTLSVEASGTGPLQYEWIYDESPIPGQTGSTYTFTPTEDTVGAYYAIVRNAAGFEESGEAEVEVILPVSVAEVEQPETLEVGEELEISVEAEGDDLVFQWRFNGVPINGADADTYAIESIRLNQAGTYTVTVSNPCNSVTREFRVSVLEPFEFSEHPADQTVKAGIAVTFRAAAKGAQRWQWFFEDAEIPGATGSTLTFSVTKGRAGDYYVQAFDALGAPHDSDSATLTVLTPPQIIAQPQGVTVDAGEPFSLFIETDDDEATIQWKKDSVVLAIETEPELTREEASSVDAGSYVCIVSNAAGSVTSNSARVVVRRLAPPVITQQPASLRVAPNAPATFRVRATGGGELTFQWYWNDEELETDGDTLTIDEVTAAAAGDYHVVVSNAGGSVSSAVATLAIENVFRAGRYSGLFYTPGDVLHESSGAIRLTATTAGRFTGSLQIGTTRYTFIGAFDSESSATFQATSAVRGRVPLDVSLSVADEDRLVGTVATADWEAEASLARAVFSAQEPCPLAGTYTVILPPDEANADAPFGYGFLTTTIAANGNFTAAGRLADGTAVTVSATTSGDGNIPLYASLYADKGSLLGWLNVIDERVAGVVSWIKPATKSGSYREGFTLTIECLGGLYDKTQPTLPTEAVLILNGANLADAIEVTMHVGARSRITARTPGALVQITATGVFTGSVINPQTRRPIIFSGVLDQAAQAGFGSFQAGGLSGEVFLGARLD